MLNNLIRFLVNKGWKEVRKDKTTDYFLAPEKLKFENDFIIRIPINQKAIDYIQHLNQIKNTIAELYDYNIEDFIKIIENTSILRFSLNPYSQIDSYPLSEFNIFDNRLKNTLLDTASFVVKPYYEISELPKEAELYYQKCNFLTPEKGSFIVRIEVMSEKIIKKDLYNEEITTKDVNDKLFNIMKFVNTNIINNEDQAIYDDNFLITHKEYFNRNILNDFIHLYSTTNQLEFNYANPINNLVTKTPDINKKNLNNITDFIKVLDNNLPFDENIIDIFCENALIVDLASQDPLEDNNMITLKGKVYNIDSIIKIKLESKDYKRAIEAHKNKRFVTVKGKGVKLKSYYRIDNLLMLTI